MRNHAIRYPLTIDGGRHSLQLERDFAEHVKQLIKQTILVTPGDRFARPDFGCGLRSMLFAPAMVSANLAAITILEALDSWLGETIRVDDVKVQVETETLFITIEYALRIDPERRVLNLEVQR